MFHMKHGRPFALIALVVFATLVVGCSKAASSRGWAAPVKSDSLLMISSAKGRINGLDAATREEKWRFPKSWDIADSNARELTGVYGDPIVAKDGNVYLGDYNGFIYVFRPGDFNSNSSEKPKAGSLSMGDKVIGGLALDESGNVLYVTAGNSLYSVNTRDLVTRIQNKDAAVKVSKLFSASGDLWTTPVLANGRTFVASLDGNLYAVDPTSGKEQWRYSSGAGLVARPEISSGTIYTGGLGGSLVAVDASDGKQKWVFKAASWVWSRPVISGGKVYIGDFDGNVYALDPSTGDEAWKFALGKGSIRGSVAVTSNAIVVATEDGWLAGISTDGSTKLWEKKIESPINADLVISGDSVLIAPERCVTNNNEKSYYVSVNPSNGDLTRASGVC